jgi:hypothetical protein
VISFGASSSASARVRPITPCFEAHRHAKASEHRRHVHYPSAGRNIRKHFARHEVHACEIRVDGAPPAGDVGTDDRLTPANAGIVHEHVYVIDRRDKLPYAGRD